MWGNMNMMLREKTNVGIFEEFFKTEYKEELSYFLEKYPDERSLTVDYNDLTKFNQGLADLLLEKPEDIIEASISAIKNISLLKEQDTIHVRFKNVANCIPIEKINSNHIGQYITTRIHIHKVYDVESTLKTAIFECKGCLRLHEVEQDITGNLIKPPLCSECGGKSFKILSDVSKYQDVQKITTSDKGKAYPHIFILHGDLVSQVKTGDYIEMSGIPRMNLIRDKKHIEYNKFFDVNYLKVIDDKNNEIVSSEELDVDVRNSKEYNNWKQEVINRDQVCQCCGGHKYLHAHHIFGYKNNREYRLNPDNGIALCKWCHGKYHSYYGKEATPATLIEFCKSFGNIIIKMQGSDLQEVINEVDNPIINDDVNDIIMKQDKNEDYRDILQEAVDEIKVLEEDYAGLAPINVLKSNLECNFTVSDDDVEEIIEKLMHKGIIYKPNDMYVKIA